SRGSLQGSANAQGKRCRRKSGAWSSARPKEGPTLGMAHWSSGKPASQPSISSYSARVTWYRNAFPPYRNRRRPPAAMWRRIRPFCSRSIARPRSARRASGGTANTPRRSSGRRGVVFMAARSLWRGPGGPSRHEIGGDHPRRHDVGALLEAVEQGRGRAAGQGVAGQADGGERRIGEAGEGDVVEPHHGKVARDREALGPARLHDTQRHQVIGGHDRGGPRRRGQDLPSGAQAAPKAEVSVVDAGVVAGAEGA